jgi:hypothetical protein
MSLLYQRKILLQLDVVLLGSHLSKPRTSTHCGLCREVISEKPDEKIEYHIIILVIGSMRSVQGVMFFILGKAFDRTDLDPQGIAEE